MSGKNLCSSRLEMFGYFMCVTWQRHTADCGRACCSDKEALYCAVLVS